jgi:two-component system cell cycle response regulator DivK
VPAALRRSGALGWGPSMTAPGDPVALALPPTGAMPQVLVVDDNPINLELAGYVLAADGWEVVTAGDALEALRCLEARHPDLILMDIQLPGMDGLTLTRQIKADPATRHITVVAFTAYAMKGDEEIMRTAGCDGYLVKPIDVSRFAMQVRDLLVGLGPR